MGLAADIEKLISESEKTKEHKEDLYEKAIIDFNLLVEKGLIKPRGYTLQTIEDKLRDMTNVKLTRTILKSRS